MDKKVLKGGITQEQLDQWVKEHGAVNDKVRLGSLENMAGVGKLHFYFRKPDKHVFALSASHIVQGNLAKAKEVMVSNCLLHAEPTLTEESSYKEQYLLGMGTVIGEAFPIPSGELEKI